MNSQLRYFSTFSGIGGFELGIQNAYRSPFGGEQTDTEADKGQRLLPSPGQGAGSTVGQPSERPPNGFDQRPLCVGYSEIDKYASSVYEYHFNGTKNYGDITKIDADDLPDFDCLVGGFPCQAFSIAGKRRGFEDTRGTLFFDLARILRAKTPRLFVFENVKGLLSHDNGNTFKTIIATIDELGYDCQWQVLNSKNHGVPQNRERIYIVGHLRGTPRPEVFPIGDGSRGNFPAHEDQQGEWEGFRSGSVSATIHTRTGSTARGQQLIATPQIRRLTPTECERLQGFPDGWTSQSTNGAVSDTQRYKMCGNAVTVNVVQAVFEKILG